MIDFRKMISPRTQAEMKAKNEALKAFASLDDKAMAEGLLTISRGLLATGAFNPDQRYSYDEWALNRVIPALALRLDPDVTLLENELPKDDESSDPITYMSGASDKKLANAVNSILSHASYSRAARQERNLHLDMLQTHSQHGNPIRVAAARAMPTYFPATVVAETEKAPLTGKYVIARHGHFDQVISYEDTDDMANAVFDFAVEVAGVGRDRAQDLAAEMREKHPDVRYRRSVMDALAMNDVYGKIEGISVEDASGRVLREHRLEDPAVGSMPELC